MEPVLLLFGLEQAWRCCPSQEQWEWDLVRVVQSTRSLILDLRRTFESPVFSGVSSSARDGFLKGPSCFIPSELWFQASSATSPGLSEGYFLCVVESMFQ